jgi:hypothetical protein
MSSSDTTVSFTTWLEQFIVGATTTVKEIICGSCNTTVPCLVTDPTFGTACPDCIKRAKGQ